VSAVRTLRNLVDDLADVLRRGHPGIEVRIMQPERKNRSDLPGFDVVVFVPLFEAFATLPVRILKGTETTAETTELVYRIGDEFRTFDDKLSGALKTAQTAFLQAMSS
jgi:hypothetical protein